MVNVESDFKLVDLYPYLSFLKDKSICIFGASGLIGKYLLLLIIYANRRYDLNIKLSAYVSCKTSVNKLKADICLRENCLIDVKSMDIKYPIADVCNYDYIVHAASPADPISYATRPIETFLTNVEGSKNILDWMMNSKAKMVYLSSGEVYGLNQPPKNGYQEDHYGFIDHLTPRACYSMGKRAAETLCRLYVEQYDSNVVIARLCHIYGPTFSLQSTRADAQFFKNALEGNDIIMKSKGDQIRSYCYVLDACTALLALLKNGVKGEAYNISNKKSTVSILEFAQEIAKAAGVNIQFSDPNVFERNGFSKVQRAVLNSNKLESLGWSALVSLSDGVNNVINNRRIN